MIVEWEVRSNKDLSLMVKKQTLSILIDWVCPVEVVKDLVRNR